MKKDKLLGFYILYEVSCREKKHFEINEYLIIKTDK